jgi:hypothetical protein
MLSNPRCHWRDIHLATKQRKKPVNYLRKTYISHFVLAEDPLVFRGIYTLKYFHNFCYFIWSSILILSEIDQLSNSNTNYNSEWASQRWCLTWIVLENPVSGLFDRAIALSLTLAYKTWGHEQKIHFIFQSLNRNFEKKKFLCPGLIGQY